MIVPPRTPIARASVTNSLVRKESTSDRMTRA